MRIFVLRLNPDTRVGLPYSKYPTLEEYKKIHSNSPMDGFHEAVNFLPESGMVRGYLPPRHLKALSEEDNFALITITAKSAEIKNDIFIGLQVGCLHEDENNRTWDSADSKELDLKWHYSCPQSQSVVFSQEISNARELILEEGKLWYRGPTYEISAEKFKKIIDHLLSQLTNIKERQKILKLAAIASGLIVSPEAQYEAESTFDSEVTAALNDNLSSVTGNELPQQRQVVAFQFIRDPAVVAYALKRANGVCERCKNRAPFIAKSTGVPFLEVHHIHMLKDGGPDTINNVIALCPNCHREAHYG